MKKFWDIVSNIGCFSDLNHSELRRIRLLNRMNLISATVFILYLIIDLYIGVYSFIPLVILMVFFFAVDVFLISKRHYETGKHFEIIILAFSISYYVLAAGETFSEALFIPLLTVPLVVFSNKSTAVFYLFFIIILLVLLKNIQPFFSPILILEGQKLLFFRSLNVLIAGIITYFFTYYFKRENEIFESKLIQMNEIVNVKNKEIIDSINYAKRLQDAIMPPLELIEKHFPTSFVLYKPKDIVAGDFYWMETIDNIVFFAAADCTGHGVPGAMVSLVCSNALYRTVKELAIFEVGKVLDKAREIVVETFERSGNEVKDGMDISFCSFNKKTNELNWAGANNPLWLIRTKELIEFKPNKQPIGKTDDPLPFLTKTIQLQKHDCIYIFTDGFADQFGGEKDKKFKYKNLKELLIANAHLPMDEQKIVLSKALSDWKGALEQVDDILIIGIRID